MATIFHPLSAHQGSAVSAGWATSAAQATNICLAMTCSTWASVYQRLYQSHRGHDDLEFTRMSSTLALDQETAPLMYPDLQSAVSWPVCGWMISRGPFITASNPFHRPFRQPVVIEFLFLQTFASALCRPICHPSSSVAFPTGSTCF